MKKVAFWMLGFICVAGLFVATIAQEKKANLPDKGKKGKKGTPKKEALRELERLADSLFMRGINEEFYYRICEKRGKPQPSAIVEACLAIQALGKKGKIDTVPLFSQILEQAKEQELRNFIHFLIAESYKQHGNYGKAMEQLKIMISEELEHQGQKSPEKLMTPETLKNQARDRLKKLAEEGKKEKEKGTEVEKKEPEASNKKEDSSFEWWKNGEILQVRGFMVVVVEKVNYFGKAPLARRMADLKAKASIAAFLKKYRFEMIQRWEKSLGDCLKKEALSSLFADKSPGVVQMDLRGVTPLQYKIEGDLCYALVGIPSAPFLKDVRSQIESNLEKMILTPAMMEAAKQRLEKLSILEWKEIEERVGYEFQNGNLTKIQKK